MNAIIVRNNILILTFFFVSVVFMPRVWQTPAFLNHKRTNMYVRRVSDLVLFWPDQIPEPDPGKKPGISDPDHSVMKLLNLPYDDFRFEIVAFFHFFGGPQS